MRPRCAPVGARPIAELTIHIDSDMTRISVASVEPGRGHEPVARHQREVGGDVEDERADGDQDELALEAVGDDQVPGEVAERDHHEGGHQQREGRGGVLEVGAEQQVGDRLGARQRDRERGQGGQQEVVDRGLEEAADAVGVGVARGHEQREERRHDRGGQELDPLVDAVDGAVEAGVARTRQLEHDHLVDVAVAEREQAADPDGQALAQQVRPERAGVAEVDRRRAEGEHDVGGVRDRGDAEEGRRHRHQAAVEQGDHHDRGRPQEAVADLDRGHHDVPDLELEDDSSAS